jgi:hypothetical protein
VLLAVSNPAVSNPAVSNPAVSNLAASDVAFGIVFGLFAAAFLVLVVVTITWAIRRDRPGREAWRQRMIERRDAAAGPDGRAGEGRTDARDDLGRGR